MVLKFKLFCVPYGENGGVSVPLRGCGFEIIKNASNQHDIKFPSPCGDVVLKLLERVEFNGNL